MSMGKQSWQRTALTMTPSSSLCLEDWLFLASIAIGLVECTSKEAHAANPSAPPPRLHPLPSPFLLLRRRHNADIIPGRAIVIGIDAGIHARVRPLEEAILQITTTSSDGASSTQTFPLEEGALAEAAQQGGFWSYVAGVAHIFVTQFHVGGLQIDNYKTTLPMKKGLSSSAAISVLVARAFNTCYGLGLTTRGEMQVAYEGERLTPSQCGRMDQALAYGRVPVVLTFKGDVLRVTPAKLGAMLHLVLVDLKASKNTVKILAALQSAYPHPHSEEERRLVHCLGPVNESITARAIAALEAGDAATLGALMSEAQAEFDAAAGPMCPSELGVEGSPVLHRVLGYPGIQSYIYGGKGVGSQGDGTAQLVCKDAASQEAVRAILEEEMGVHCIKMTIEPTHDKGVQPSGLADRAGAGELVAWAGGRDSIVQKKRMLSARLQVLQEELRRLDKVGKASIL